MTSLRCHSFVCAGLLAAASLPAQGLPGYRYRFEMTEEGGKRVTGRTEVAGSRARIDLDRDDSSGDYLLLSNDGHTVTIVHTARREYSVVDDTTFQRIVGTALRAVPFLSIRVGDAQVDTERLGAGEPLLGHPTERYRLTQDFTVSVGAMGVHGTTVHQRVVTEYWVASDLALPHNPLIAFVSQLETALAQTDRRFAHRTEEALRPLVRSTALRVVVHAESRDEDGKVERKTRTLALTALERSTVDAARLAVPAGYTRRDVDLKFGF